MRILILAAIVVLAVSGCGGEGEPPEGTTAAPGEPTAGGELEPTAGTQQQAAMQAICPMEVQGTTVQAENVEGGAALVFMTSGDVEDLRERVRHYAAMKEAHAMRAEPMAMPGDPTQDREAAGAKAAEQGAMPQIDTRVEDIEGGARLVFVPNDPAALDQVRAEVQDEALAMTAGECPAVEQQGMQGHEGMQPGTEGMQQGTEGMPATGGAPGTEGMPTSPGMEGTQPAAEPQP